MPYKINQGQKTGGAGFEALFGKHLGAGFVGEFFISPAIRFVVGQIQQLGSAIEQTFPPEIASNCDILISFFDNVFISLPFLYIYNSKLIQQSSLIELIIL